MKILGPLPTSNKMNQRILVTWGRLLKVKQTVPLRTVTASTCSSAFIHGWILLYRVPPMFQPITANLSFQSSSKPCADYVDLIECSRLPINRKQISRRSFIKKRFSLLYVFKLLKPKRLGRIPRNGDVRVQRERLLHDEVSRFRDSAATLSPRCFAPSYVLDKRRQQLLVVVPPIEYCHDACGGRRTNQQTKA